MVVLSGPASAMQAAFGTKLRVVRSRGAKHRGRTGPVLVPRLLYPVSEEVYEDFFASVRAGLVIEQSHQGQLYRLIRMFVDTPCSTPSN